MATLPAEVRLDQPEHPKALLLLAHGAGAPMDSPFMNQLCQALLAQAVTVIRFEFTYMQQRRADGRRRPPPAINTLVDEYQHMIQAVGAWQTASPHVQSLPLWLAGKSMGGRVATLVAAQQASESYAGVAVFGYPFHPPGKPENTRIAHFGQCSVPVHIFQGTRDPFGRPEEVADYCLPATVTLHWLATGNHDAEPTKKSGISQQALLQHAAESLSRLMVQPEYSDTTLVSPSVASH